MKNRIILLFLFSVCFLTADAQNKYLTKVFEYCPAPGQFVHRIPAYEEGDNTERIVAKCLVRLSDKNIISLGGFGGYVTVGFDHTILNVKGQKDILVQGNAFIGSSEPGIVMVSTDTNGDGIPNDEWYELAGSEYDNSSTIHGYEITYMRPANDNGDVDWKDNQGRTGVIRYMGFVANYPKWINENTLTFKGTCLPDNGKCNGEQGLWFMQAYDFGYADNFPNEDMDGCSLDIDWAVDKQGDKVNLNGIDFVRIYTGVNQQIPPAGGVGELSTEVSGVEDIHPTATSLDTLSGRQAIFSYQNGNLMVSSEQKGVARLYSLQGHLLKEWMQEDKLVVIPICLSDGVYIIRSSGSSCKLIVR